MHKLFIENTPDKFWRCDEDIDPEQWNVAIKHALSSLEIFDGDTSIHDLLLNTLGEGRYGNKHWELSYSKRLYYSLKPVLPRKFRVKLRKLYGLLLPNYSASWPIEDQYVQFLWKVMHELLSLNLFESLHIVNFWPGLHRFSFVLTHDVESFEGLAHVQRLADLEQSLGFRSSFNFIPEKYSIDKSMLYELTERGFEIGVHGLKHDGKLFSSKDFFRQRVTKINQYLGQFGAMGFRSPLTHRNPAWMQALEIDYDLSFFDTDPFEPIPGGTMSIWPFHLGHFVELPYTLPQDSTLINLLGEYSTRIWREKVAFIERYHGMVLLNTHPDYLSEPSAWRVYEDFLGFMKAKDGYWHALPKEISNWWRIRSNTSSPHESEDLRAMVYLNGDSIAIDVNPNNQPYPD